MSSTNQVGKKLAVGEQASEHVDGAGRSVGADGPELRPSVAQETQAKIDFDLSVRSTRDRFYGRTLAEEERLRGEEAELGWYSERARQRQEWGVDAEAETREFVSGMASRETAAFQARLSEFAIPKPIPTEDPREGFTRAELAVVNQQAQRLAASLRNGPSRAAIGRRLAERVDAGADVTSAVLELKEEMELEAGVIQPIGSIEPWHYEADVEGEVVTLWTPKSATQQQVGLVRDRTGTVKLTIWVKSNQSVVLHEGDRVQIRGGKVGCYQGRVTLAADSKTMITKLEEACP